MVRDENVILRHRETKDIYRPFGGRVRWHYEAYVAFEPIGLTGKGLNHIHDGHFDKIGCYCRKDYARRK